MKRSLRPPATAIDALDRRELHRLEHLSPAELDELPFGAVQLDREGRVVRYNRTEARLAGRDPAQVLGRSFFGEVAPCADVPAFAGRFRAGVAARQLQERLDFCFDYKMAPREVTVTLFYSDVTGNAWIFVLPRGASSAAGA